MTNFTSRISIFLALFMLIASCSSYRMNNAGRDTGPNTNKVNASFEEPAGWKKSNKANGLIFEAEENDLSMTVVYISKASSDEEAAKKAWLDMDSSFNREVRLNEPRDPSGGWDNKRRIEYVTSVGEKLTSVAYTHEINGQWYVVLLSGNSGTVNKRSGAIRSMLGSFEVEGYTPEDLSAKQVKQLTAKDIEEYLMFIERSAKLLNVPGVGIAISQNGKVLYQGGVGLGDIEKQEKVSAETVFMIASNTKSMATLLIAKLVEMGKLDWQDKVIDHFPGFRLGDDETTKSVLIEHLVCACTGLPRRDLGWLFNNSINTPASSVFDELALNEPTSKFGEIFQYSNELAAAAGYVAAHVLYPDMEIGEAFDKAMKTYIFDPLEMNSTGFSMQFALSRSHAKPYADDLNGKATLIEQTETTGFNHTVYAYRPAGGAWSSPADMIKYVQNELSLGVDDKDQTLFAKEHLLARRKHYVVSGSEMLYGMGLETIKIAGIKTVTHGGSMAGYKSNFFAFPDANVGLVILTNSDEGWALLSPSARKLVEMLYDGKALAEKKIAVNAESKGINLQTLREEFVYPGDNSVIAKLAKSYNNDILGQIRIYEEKGVTYLDPDVWRTPIGTKKNPDGTTSIVATAPFMLGMELLIGESENRKTLTINYAQDSFTFVESGE